MALVEAQVKGMQKPLTDLRDLNFWDTNKLVACKSLQLSPGSAAAKASEKELEELPEPVKRYLRYSLENGASAITFCSLKQNGVFRCVQGSGLGTFSPNSMTKVECNAFLK